MIIDPPIRCQSTEDIQFLDLLDLKCFNTLLSIERKVTVTYFVVAVQKVLKFNTLFTYGRV